jgi:hypothetical protein
MTFIFFSFSLDGSCSVNWETQTLNATTYIVFLFIFGLIVPVSVITYSYSRIIRTMKGNALRAGRVNKIESRVTLMIAIMIAGEQQHQTTQTPQTTSQTFPSHSLSKLFSSRGHRTAFSRCSSSLAIPSSSRQPSLCCQL